MLKLSPQSNGCPADARTGKVRGVPAYPGRSSWRVSDKILDEGVTGGDDGRLRFGAIAESSPLKNSAPTKSRLIWKAG